MTLLIAHRGDTNSFQENTLEAFVSAFDKGAHGIELDIHLHHDKIIVVHEFLYDQTKKYPTLEGVLEQIHTRGRIEIEVKEFDTNILSPLHTILHKFPQADIELATSEIPLAPYIKTRFPNIQLGVIFQDALFPDWMTPPIVQRKILGWGKMLKADCLHIPLRIVSQNGKESLVHELHKAGFAVHCHIFKTDEQGVNLTNIVNWGVDQCTIDDIGLVNSSYVH